MQSTEPRLPLVKVYLDQASGKLWFKTCEKGARWHKNVANIQEVSKHTSHLPRPIEIEYVTEDEL